MSVARPKKPKFPKRIELGEGYPWAYGLGPYFDIVLCEKPQGMNKVRIAFPDELWRQDVPKYRLVLEKVS